MACACQEVLDKPIAMLLIQTSSTIEESAVERKVASIWLAGDIIWHMKANFQPWKESKRMQAARPDTVAPEGHTQGVGTLA